MKKLLVGAFALLMLAACNAGEDHQLNQNKLMPWLLVVQ